MGHKFNGSSSTPLIEGMIPIVSYQAPLPGEKAPGPGIAYWFPPGASGPFSGPKELVEPLVTLLRHGKFPAKISRDVRAEALIPSTALSVLIAALESCHWSFQKLLKGPELKIACQAFPEALQIVTRHRGIAMPVLVPLLLRPTLIRSVILMSRWMVPFDFETYLKIHFTKVQPQMHQILKDSLRLAHQYSIPAPSLTLLSSGCSL